jgi:hypothetical protein
MPGPTKIHDLAQVVLTIGGYTISGYGEGGAVKVEPVSSAVESTVGHDGQVTYSRTNDARAKVTITVRGNSVAHKHLSTLMQAQLAAPVLAPMAFLLVNAQTGERFASAYFVFLEHPGVEQAKGVTDRVYIGELPYGFDAGNYDAAPLVAV